MRKEIIIVVLVGIAIGIVVAFGVYTAQTAIRNKKTKPTQVQEATPTPTIPTQEEHSLSIIEPENNTLVDQAEITVVGSTTPNAVVTIIASENEYLLTAGSDGKFSSTVSLVGGANDLIITAFDANGKRAEKNLMVVYSTAKL